MSHWGKGEVFYQRISCTLLFITLSIVLLLALCAHDHFSNLFIGICISQYQIRMLLCKHSEDFIRECRPNRIQTQLRNRSDCQQEDCLNLIVCCFSL